MKVEQIKSNILSTIDCTVQVMVIEIPSLHRVGAMTEIKAFVVVEGGTVSVKKKLLTIQIFFMDGNYDVTE